MCLPTRMAVTSWHTDKSFRIFLKSNRKQIVFTIFRLIWNQTDVRSVPNQSENGKYNLISVWFNKIWKIFPCVCTGSGYAPWGASTRGAQPAVHQKHTFSESIVENLCVPTLCLAATKLRKSCRFDHALQNVVLVNDKQTLPPQKWTIFFPIFFQFLV